MHDMHDHRPARYPKLLITAGPTHEPIDAVRFLGNRSSGRLGVALADHAARRGWPTTLLLGPTPLEPEQPDISLHRYTSCADLEALLKREFPACGVLIMAAAVSDYRPARSMAPGTGKLRRKEQKLTLELEPTPDLLAGCAALRSGHQVLVGFALEPRERLIESARAKLERKSIDMIVANPLETMNAETIEASLIYREPRPDGRDRLEIPAGTHKAAFAGWLLDRVLEAYQSVEAQPRDSAAR